MILLIVVQWAMVQDMISGVQIMHFLIQMIVVRYVKINVRMGSGTNDCSQTQFNPCTFTQEYTWGWRTMKPLVPANIAGEVNQLAWILYSSVNGQTVFNSAMDKSKYSLYNRQLLAYPNLGGNADGAIQTEMKNNGYDTIQLTMQPDADAVFAYEILAWNIDYTRDNTTYTQAPSYRADQFATKDPLTTNIQTGKLVNNPADTTNQNQLLVCDKLTFGMPYCMPIWPGQTQPNETANM